MGRGEERAVRQPANELVIRYLERAGPQEDDRPPRPGQRDHWEAGSHPDVVARIWDQLGRSLPVESKRVVCGTPALVGPSSKVLIVVAVGTQYAIRLPAELLRAGISSTVRTETVWAGGRRWNVQAEFGSDWVLGSYSAEEEAWCRQAFEEYESR